MLKHTWYFFVVTLAGFINRQQQDMIAYLQEENRILRKKLGDNPTMAEQPIAAFSKRLGVALGPSPTLLDGQVTALHSHK